MDRLDIEGSRYTPAISCDPHGGHVAIRGYSYPENAAGFYQPLLTWIDAYLRQDPALELGLDVELVYFNSSSSKILLDLFDLLDDRAAAGHPVWVRWHYDEDNESARECGQEFQQGIRRLPFALASKPGGR